MKTLILILSVLVMQWCLLFSQDTKQHTKVEPKEVPELTGFKWSFSFSGGIMISGYDNKFKKALIDAGYNKSLKLFSDDDIISYPHSYKEIGFSINLNRWVNKYITLSLNYNKVQSNTTGFNGYKMLNLYYRITSYTPLIKYTPLEFLFFGIGPVFSTIKHNNSDENITFKKIGLAMDASIRFNENTESVFGFFDLKYNILGSEIVGPFIDNSPAHLNFPANKIGFSYGYIGLGLGFRFL